MDIAILAIVELGILAMLTQAVMDKRKGERPFPAWVWPCSTKSDSNVMIRFGRLLHWISAVAAALWLLSFAIGAVPTCVENGFLSALGIFTLGLAISAITLMIGRGLRYVFAGE